MTLWLLAVVNKILVSHTKILLYPFHKFVVEFPWHARALKHNPGNALAAAQRTDVTVTVRRLWLHSVELLCHGKHGKSDFSS